MSLRWHYVLLITASLLLLPVVYILLYVYPSTDDYCLSAFIRDQGWGWTQHFVYTQWGGRFTSTFFLSLDPLVYGSLWGYRFMSLSLMLLMGWGIYRIIAPLFIPTALYIYKLTVTLLLLLLLFLLQPSPVEAWYWYASAYTYQLSLVILLFTLPALWKYARQPEQKFPVAAFIFFSLNLAMNEVIMVVQCFLLLVLLVLRYQQTTKFKMQYLIWGMLLMTVFILTVVAPGNVNRGEGILIRISPVLAAWLSLQHWFSFAGYWLLVALPFAFLIRIYTLDFVQLKSFRVVKDKVKAAWIVFFLLLSVVPVFTVYLIANYDPPERVLNMSAFFFLIAMLLLAFTLPVLPQKNLKFLAFLLYFLLSIFSSIKSNAWVRLTNDLFSGKASAYAQEMQEREQLLQSCEEDCLLPPLQHKPVTIFFRELNEEPGKWPNDCYAEYYRKRSVGLKRPVRRVMK